MSYINSDSDFDDEDDPDKIQIPGGGKDLASISNISKEKEVLGQNTLKTEQFKEKSINRGEVFVSQFNYDSIKAVHLHSNFNEFKKKENEDDDEEANNNELSIAETYSNYMPVKLNFGRKHPDPVVETASLSSVEPTDVWYKMRIPVESIRSGALSALQLEAITYASQQHEKFLPNGCRAGFLIGDGAGVGKGRTIAGIIFENYLIGRKRSIWISVSNDLKYDAERDLKDIGASKIQVHSLNKLKYAKIMSTLNGNISKGVIFSTYSALIGESSQNIGKYKSRLQQLIEWCGDNFDGVIIFDECHRAKNLCPSGSSKPSKTGLTVLEIQNKLPKARIVYASATGASEPKNMAYMVRLGIWGEGTPFSDFDDFISAVEKRGVGVMEIVAMDLKLRGMYIARQLSFHGVVFRIEEVPFSSEFKKTYNDSVKLWVEAMQNFQEAANVIDAGTRMKKTMWSQFWSSHQRFFKYLCIAAKVKYAINLAREAVKCGKCVVIGLQSTGEARTLEQLERHDGDLSDFVSTAKGVFQSLVEKHFPAPNRSRIHQVLGLDFSKINTECKYIDKKPLNHSATKRKFNESVNQNILLKKSFCSSKDKNIEESFQKHFTDTEDEFNSEDGVSDINSDYNPFGSDSDSDSDVDPWDKRRKKSESINNQSIQNDKSFEKLMSNQTSIHKSSNICKKSDEKIIKVDSIEKSNYLPKKEIENAYQMKEQLLSKIEELGKNLPPNTLDQLIDELGGPESVAEMTGRKGRVIQMEDGTIQYVSRAEDDIPLETLNIIEKKRFMNGDKMIAIISEAASSGISLHSDRRMRNQRRRVHITLELPWSADRAIQQFGRTHRSNQVNPPEYIFLISDLAGERRFASTIAKRLESLGALTHGDRRATKTSDFSQFNIDNKYGRSALEIIMKVFMGYESPLVPFPVEYQGSFFQDIIDALVGVSIIYNNEDIPGVLTLDKDYNNISKFLNRILGIPVDKQNLLFQYFSDTLSAIILNAKKIGHFDLGILDLGSSGEKVDRDKVFRYNCKHATGTAFSELHMVHIDRGMNWTEAVERWSQLTGEHEGFYLSLQVRNENYTALLAIAFKSAEKHQSEKESNQLYVLYRPNTGLQMRQEILSNLRKNYRKATLDEVKNHWIMQYKASSSACSHIYWQGICMNIRSGKDCEIGLRRRSYTVLAGSILSVWRRVERIIAASCGNNSKMQVVRLRLNEHHKIIGILIPKICRKSIQEVLSQDSESIEEQTF